MSRSVSQTPAGWASASGWTPQLGPPERLLRAGKRTWDNLPQANCTVPSTASDLEIGLSASSQYLAQSTLIPTKPTAIIRARCGSSPESALISANTASMHDSVATRTCAATSGSVTKSFSKISR